MCYKVHHYTHLSMLCKYLQTHQKKGGVAHLNKHTARGTWSLPDSKLHINYLELKAVFLALKEFQDLCLNNIVFFLFFFYIYTYIT